MQRFIDFVVRFKNVITLCLLVVMSFSLMSFGDLAKLGGFRAVVVGSIGWMQSLFSWIPNPVALKSENAALRELNLQLSLESSRSRQAIVENTTLRKMLDLQKTTEYRLIATDVVGKTTTQLRNYITLNKGVGDGIKEGMCVISDAGLVGVIIASSDHYSVVQMLLNRDARVAAKVQRSRVDGILMWEGDSHLSLKNVPKSFDVKVGDIVLTSNYSAKFPPNVVVGLIEKVADENNSLFRQVKVRPAVNFATLEQVFVVEYIPTSDRLKVDSLVRDRQTTQN